MHIRNSFRQAKRIQKRASEPAAAAAITAANAPVAATISVAAATATATATAADPNAVRRTYRAPGHISRFAWQSDRPSLTNMYPAALRKEFDALAVISSVRKGTLPQKLDAQYTGTAAVLGDQFYIVKGVEMPGLAAVIVAASLARLKLKVHALGFHQQTGFSKPM